MPSSTASNKPFQTIAIGTNIQSGPFGGGNQFAQVLTHFLKARHIKVVSNLTNSHIDVILVTSVKPWARGAAFDIAAALNYCRRHPSTIIVLRVNECDERKGYSWPLLNNVIRGSISQADHAVFVSAWLQNLLLRRHPSLKSQSSVIKSGADPAIFNPSARAVWNGHETLKIVTHHWSNSWYKGWDVYEALDTWLGTTEGQNYSFTFIGNPWPKATLKHVRVLPPQNGQQLARTLKGHHVYISASQNEPAGMHYIEAMQCGLPTLWRRSGSLPEYCEAAGLGFAGPHDVIAALQRLRHEYQRWHNSVANPSYTADDMCQAYLNLFQTLHSNPHPRPSHALSFLRLQQGLLWARDSLV